MNLEGLPRPQGPMPEIPDHTDYYVGMVAGDVEQLIETAKRHPFLEADEERSLFEIYRQGQQKLESQLQLSESDHEEVVEAVTDARNQLVFSNVLRVVKVAKQYSRHQPQKFEELMSEGMLGLLVAVEGFDTGRGVRFGTYATKIIRRYVALANSINPLVYKPINKTVQLAGFIRYRSDLTQILGREPTYQDMLEEGSYSPKILKQLLGLSQNPRSLNEPVTEGGDELQSFIVDEQTENIEAYESRVLLERVIQVMNDVLGEEDVDMMLNHMGLKTGRRVPLAEMARQRGITRAGMHARYKKALTAVKVAYRKRHQQD